MKIDMVKLVIICLTVIACVYLATKNLHIVTIQKAYGVYNEILDKRSN